MTRFLDRNSAHLADRRIWVVQRQPAGDPAAESGRGPIRLSRLLVRNGVAAETYAGTGSHRRPEVVPTAPAALRLPAALRPPRPATRSPPSSRPVSA